jgi:anti-sigma factor RsiW
MTACRDLQHLLDPCTDGELEVEKQMEVESHVDSCSTCRERVELLRAMKGSLRRTPQPKAPEGMMERARAAMLAEKSRIEARESQKRLTPWRTIVPLATAAAFALAWGAMTKTSSRSSSMNTEHAGFGDELLAELVTEHSQPLPYDAKDPNEVRNFEKYVGVPVKPGAFQTGKCPPRPTTQLPCGRANFVGARVVPVRQERAAMLHYEIEDGTSMRRVSVIVFDPRRINVDDMDDLQPHPIGTSQVQVGHANGYSVAVTQREGVGYAIASDMDESQTAELAVYRTGGE